MKKLLALAALVLAAACAHAPRPEGNLPPSPARPAPSAAVSTPAQPAGPPERAAGARAGDAETPAAPPPAAAPAPAAPAPAPAPLTFAAVGDVMLGSTFPDETGGLLPPDDGKTLLAEVTPLLSGADVAFANLEGPLVDGGTSEKCARAKPGRCYAFRVPTRYGKLLAAAGIDVVSLANNHVGDFGDAGRASTRRTLDAVGIRYSGAPGEIAHLVVRGRRIALVAFATSAGTNDLRDLDGARRLVAEARKDADVVVVSMHGGAEGAAYQHVPPGDESFLGEDRGDLRAFARAVIDAGADLVVGHGPHVVRGMEVVHGHLVAYSLGNFATYGGMNLSGPNGLTLVLDVTLAPDGTFLGGRIHAARQERPGGPHLDPAGAIVAVVRRLSQEDFGPTAVQVADDGTLSPPGPARATASATTPGSLRAR